MSKRAQAVKHTSISLGGHFEKFISRQVATGRFGTASEVVRAALRLMEEEEAKLAALNAALEQGEKSGFADDYSLEKLLSKLEGEPSR